MLPLTFVQKAVLWTLLVVSIGINYTVQNKLLVVVNADGDLYGYILKIDSASYKLGAKENITVNIGGVERKLPVVQNHLVRYLQPDQLDHLIKAIQNDGSLQKGVTFCPCDSAIIKYDTSKIDYGTVIGEPSGPPRPPSGGEDVDYLSGSLQEPLYLASYRDVMANAFYSMQPRMSSSKGKKLIGVLDSGMDPEIFRAPEIYYHNPTPTISYMNDWCGYNFVNLNNNPIDDNGHGSAVINIIISNFQSKSKLTNYRIVPLKVLDSNNVCTTFELCCAIRYSTLNKIDMLNMSLGYYAYDDIVEHFLRQYVEAGGIAFCSAGNNDKELNEVTNHYPSGYKMKNIVEICALGPLRMERACFSNYRTVDEGIEGVIDNGSQIQVRNPVRHVLNGGSSFRFVNGTSFASPRTLCRYVNNYESPTDFISLINNLTNPTHLTPKANRLGE